jgi:hypothetical protein
MADKVKVKLLRPLVSSPDRLEAGSTAEFDRPDAERLAGYGAVEIVGASKSEKAPANKMDAAPENKAMPKSTYRAALDPDENGRNGGSLKGEQSTRARGAAKRKG